MNYICFGKTPLYDRERLGAVLSSLLEGENAATHWGTQDGGRREPVDHDTMVELVDGVPSVKAMYLQRRTTPSWSGVVSLGRRPCISLVGMFSTTRMFDALDDAFHPDVSVAWLGPGPPKEWTNDDDRDLTHIAVCAALAPVDYYRVGPRGLSMRTVFGPHYVAQFGEDLLLDTPLVVTALDWGGLRLELIDDLFDIDIEQMLATWRRASDHLAGVEIFAPARIDEERQRIRFKRRGAAVTIGGVIPKQT